MLQATAEALAYLAYSIQAFSNHAERLDEDKPYKYLALGGLNELYSIQHDFSALLTRLSTLADKANR